MPEIDPREEILAKEMERAREIERVRAKKRAKARAERNGERAEDKGSKQEVNDTDKHYQEVKGEEKKTQREEVPARPVIAPVIAETPGREAEREEEEVPARPVIAPVIAETPGREAEREEEVKEERAPAKSVLSRLFGRLTPSRAKNEEDRESEGKEKEEAPAQPLIAPVMTEKASQEEQPAPWVPRPEAPDHSGRNRILGWVAVGLVVVIIIGSLAYFNPSVFGMGQSQSITFSFTTTSRATGSTTRTTTTKASTAHSVVVESATIFDDRLSMTIENAGVDWTKNITVLAICTPNLLNCFSYATLSGHSLTGTFALAPQSKTVYNITGICVVPMLSCAQFHPVVGYKYYYAVSIGYESGSPTVLPVIATATNTYPSNAALKGLTYSLDAYPKNSSGLLTINFLVSKSIKSAAFIARLFSSVGTGAFAMRLPYKEIECGTTLKIKCSTGKITLTESFSTVQTGVGTPIYPPPYLVTFRDFAATGTVYFAVWIPALSN
jgi:hypothetical protein